MISSMDERIERMVDMMGDWGSGGEREEIFLLAAASEREKTKDWIRM